MTRPRKGSRAEVVSQLRALSGGGLGALRVAEELLAREKESGEKQLVVRFPRSRLDALHALAKERGTTLSKVVKDAVEEWAKNGG